MSNQLTRIMRSALPHLKYESKSFEMAFKKAYNGLLSDAEASGYDLGVTSPEVTDDPFIFLEAIVAEMEDDGEDVTVVDENDSDKDELDEWPDEPANEG